MRPRLLDLFSCSGVGAEGYHRAGFEVVGVDIEPQPNYPFEFVRADALLTLRAADLRPFAAIHASPPCQRFSDLAKRNGNADEWPDLIEPVRALLKRSGLPYVIENVEGAPLLDPVTLCGTMFPGLQEAAMSEWITTMSFSAEVQLRIIALELAVESHGEAAGEPSDKCFVARARVFEDYLRGES